MLKEAMFYEELEDNKVRCNLCPRHCIILEGKRGFCRARKNIGGKLYAMGYGKLSSVAIDPIEKKPLFHFYPGSSVLSIATGGCNFRCKHCQNWQISQKAPDEIPYREMYPEDIVNLAVEYNCEGISYTYTEPTIFYEIMYDTAILARKHGLYNAMVTNGYIEEEPLKKLPVDAMNIDIKGNAEFYKKVCQGTLDPVLRTCVLAKKLGIHVEVTNLIIPGYNDNEDDILYIIEFVKERLGEETPLHFTRFHPDYMLMDVPPTPVEILEKARNMALEEGLKYVYIGNVPGHEGEHTYCPNCGALLIRRDIYTISIVNLDLLTKPPRCSLCGEKIDIITK
ncbi:AmmeMemoRadiSam system radical SAM enzyme [Methanotorris igneus]|uniref:Radical SAM domain protein n=1 Tax=Methanotorris igneus (strain DSM 5666 / JCM 11834 / Kol 5) TaxID=880724 RepID=F6BCC6_METIK|nr:AmmeMemoRadiSam system radical SAM enzyme [Methanotorris igneus]AEF97332.1 Radical SAM domain protein [Methanotorris igneus Kol 5]